MKQVGLVYGVSTVADGNMSFKWGEKNEVNENRGKFLKKIGINKEDCVYTSLVHGKDVVVIGVGDRGKTIEADGFITVDRGVAIIMMTGDCLPVVYFDKKKHILGMSHLGWRGVDKELARIMVENLVRMGSDPKDLQMWIGPGVRKETYWKYGKGVPEFKKNVDLNKWGSFLEDKPGGQLALDLVGFVKHQVQTTGVLEKSIEVSPIDTVINQSYFSQFRSDKLVLPQGRFATVVMLK